MQIVFSSIQLVISVLLITCILLQTQGSGFGTTWNGGGETYHTRRGIEKVVFYATIALGTAFVLSSLGLIMR